MSSQSTLTRGYTVALISAVILSTTAVFIRYLTQTYAIEPLVLAFCTVQSQSVAAGSMKSVNGLHLRVPSEPTTTTWDSGEDGSVGN